MIGIGSDRGSFGECRICLNWFRVLIRLKMM